MPPEKLVDKLLGCDENHKNPKSPTAHNTKDNSKYGAPTQDITKCTITNI